jgi:hypothetical protein
MPSALPFTGDELVPWLIGGLLVLALGLLALALAFANGRRLRKVHVLLVLCLLIAACMQDQQPTATPDRTEVRQPADEGQSEEEDDPQDEERVKGRRFQRGGDEVQATDAASDAVAQEPGVPTGPVEPVEPEATVTGVPITEIVEIPVAAPEPAPLGPVSGDNTLSYTWDESAREITAAASGRILRPAAITSLLSALSIQSPFIGVDVELTNTGMEPVEATGRLVLSIADSAGRVITRLESGSINETLDPGDSISTRFSYALPSGDYVSVANFEAN